MNMTAAELEMRNKYGVIEKKKKSQRTGWFSSGKSKSKGSQASSGQLTDSS